MCELVVLVSTWIFEISYRSEYVGLLVLHVLLILIETLAHCQNVVRLSLFYRCYLGICPSKLANLVPVPDSCWRSCIVIIECIFFPSFLDIIRVFMSTEYIKQLS